MYFLPALNLGARDALAREMTVVSCVDAGIILLAVVHGGAGSPRSQKALRGLALYTLISAIGAHTAAAFQVVHQTPTGSWYDFAWTLPSSSARFGPPPGSQSRRTTRAGACAQSPCRKSSLRTACLPFSRWSFFSGGPIGSGMETHPLQSFGSFVCVLRLAHRHDAVPPTEDRRNRSPSELGNGFLRRWHGHFE